MNSSRIPDMLQFESIIFELFIKMITKTYGLSANIDSADSLLTTSGSNRIRLPIQFLRTLLVKILISAYKKVESLHQFINVPPLVASRQYFLFRHHKQNCQI
jgi:hypothetical protein